MKKTKQQKALTMSALILPGLGQLYLKLYVRGSILAGTSLLALIYVVHDMLTGGVVERANTLVYQLLDGSVSPDFGTVEKLLHDGPDQWGAEVASWLIVLCWIVGVIDAMQHVKRSKLAQAT